MKAIVYTSKAGHTKKYAEILSEKIRIPSMELKDAKKKLNKQDDIIYLGWLLASKVKGLSEADNQFNIKAICGVGMSFPNEKILTDIKVANTLSDERPLFYLQGGFDREKAGFFMNQMIKMVIRQLEKKTDRSEEDENTLRAMKDNKDFVNEENLTAIVTWYQL
ncbi:MAG: flavodoxin domain-containing protein [Lachnospiraceae bacterium]|nr:flavodoxin domain-containing protein [Lachnospiraceae bacterium]